jgi:hypothetical protein
MQLTARSYDAHDHELVPGTAYPCQADSVPVAFRAVPTLVSLNPEQWRSTVYLGDEEILTGPVGTGALWANKNAELEAQRRLAQLLRSA